MKITPFVSRLKKIRHTCFVGQINSQKASVLDKKHNSGPLPTGIVSLGAFLTYLMKLKSWMTLHMVSSLNNQDFIFKICCLFKILVLLYCIVLYLFAYI